MKLHGKVDKYGPAFCIGLGFAFYIGTIVETVKTTVQATRKIDKKKEQIAKESIVDIKPEEVKMTRTDIIKEVGPDYIYPGLMFLSSTILLAGGICAIADVAGGAMASYMMAKNENDSLKEAAKEVVGESKAKKIEEVAAEKDAERTPVPANPECTGYGNTLYYVPYFNDYFRSSPEGVNRAILDFLKGLNYVNNYQSYEDFLHCLEVYPDKYESLTVGNLLGWTPEDGLDINVRWKENSPEPCGIITFSVPPHPDYDKFG